MMHSAYSENKEGWFPWLYRMAGIKPGERVLELGCGDGSLWIQNVNLIPDNASIILTDISDGIVRETGKKLAGLNHDIQCQVMDAHHIYAEDGSFDVVIANHMLFYQERRFPGAGTGEEPHLMDRRH